MWRHRSRAEQVRDLTRQNSVLEEQMERDRRWRLDALPTLLDAEAWAKRAYIRVAELDALNDRLLTRVDELTREVERLTQRQTWVNVNEPQGRP